MSVKDDRFIFTKEHRRLTYLGGLAILPLFLTALSAGLLWVTNIAILRQYLELLISAGYIVQITIWLVLPIISIVLSYRAKRYGTRRYLRSWNSFLYWLAIGLLGLIAVLVAMNLLT